VGLLEACISCARIKSSSGFEIDFPPIADFVGCIFRVQSIPVPDWQRIVKRFAITSITLPSFLAVYQSASQGVAVSRFFFCPALLPAWACPGIGAAPDSVSGVRNHPTSH
jgi:hypothetical protein